MVTMPYMRWRSRHRVFVWEIRNRGSRKFINFRLSLGVALLSNVYLSLSHCLSLPGKWDLGPIFPEPGTLYQPYCRSRPAWDEGLIENAQAFCSNSRLRF